MINTIIGIRENEKRADKNGCNALSKCRPNDRYVIGPREADSLREADNERDFLYHRETEKCLAYYFAA